MRLKELMVRAIDSDPLQVRKRVVSKIAQCFYFEGFFQLGNKAIDVGWKKAFYEPISVARKLRNSSNGAAADSAAAAELLENHLFHAIGVFTNLASVLASRYEVKVSSEAGLVCQEVAGFTLTPLSHTLRNSSSEKTWAEAAVRKIIVILGKSRGLLAVFSARRMNFPKP